MASFKVHGGDFKAGSGSLLFDSLSLPKGGFSFETLPMSSLISLDVVTQENKKKLLGTLGGGAAGMILLGPIGAIGGMLLGGNKTNITFVGTLRDGRTFVGTSDPSTFAKLKAAATKWASSRASLPSAPPPPPSSVPIQHRTIGTLPVNEGGSAMLLQASRTFIAMGWTVNEVPKRPGRRHGILHVSNGNRAIAIAITDDQINAYNVNLMGNDMVNFCSAGDQIAVGKSISRDANDAARTRGMIIGQHDEAAKLIENAISRCSRC